MSNASKLMEKYPDAFATIHLEQFAVMSQQELRDYLLKKSKEVLGNQYDSLVLPVPNYTKSCDIQVTHPEFICMCPKTGLPDMAHFKITYRPINSIMELKSFKLFSTLFHNIGIFHENVTEFLGETIWDEINPMSLHIEGTFNARGGIGTTVYYSKSLTQKAD